MLANASRFVSELVIDEISGGDLEIAAERLAIVRGLPVLPANDDVCSLVHAYGWRLGLTGHARADLPHYAFAVAHSMDYLVTWNCAHIANGAIVRQLIQVN